MILKDDLYTMGDNDAFLNLLREIRVDTARLICYHLSCLNQVQEVLVVGSVAA